MRQVDGMDPASRSVPQGACRLDHNGCVVCSDAGIPVRVLALEGHDALCEDAAGDRASIAIEFVAPVEVGDVLLTHGGVAIGRVLGGTAEGLSYEEDQTYEIRQ